MGNDGGAGDDKREITLIPCQSFRNRWFNLRWGKPLFI